MHYCPCCCSISVVPFKPTNQSTRQLPVDPLSYWITAAGTGSSLQIPAESIFHAIRHYSDPSSQKWQHCCQDVLKYPSLRRQQNGIKEVIVARHKKWRQRIKTRSGVDYNQKHISTYDLSLTAGPYIVIPSYWMNQLGKAGAHCRSWILLACIGHFIGAPDPSS